MTVNHKDIQRPCLHEGSALTNNHDSFCTIQTIHYFFGFQDLSIPAVKVIVKDANVREGVPASLMSDSHCGSEQATAAQQDRFGSA